MLVLEELGVLNGVRSVVSVSSIGKLYLVWRETYRSLERDLLYLVWRETYGSVKRILNTGRLD